MTNWLKKTWNNKFIRDRIFAFILLGLMFTAFWHADHATTDFQRGVGIIPGLLCFLTLIALMFEDFDPNDQEGRGRDGRKHNEDRDENDRDGSGNDADEQEKHDK